MTSRHLDEAMKPVHLSTVRDVPVAEVVGQLEDLADRARAGEIIGFAAGVACRERHTASVFVIGESTIADLYLGLERAQLRLLEEQ